MPASAKPRMTVWCLLAFASVALVIMIGLMLFSEPGQGGGPFNHGSQSAPASH